MKKGKGWILLILILGIMIFCKEGLHTKAMEKESKVRAVTEDMGSLLKELEASHVKKLISFAREQVEKGNWETEEGIEQAIKEGEKEFKVTLSKEQKKKIHGVIKKIKELRLTPEFILEQAEKIYDKYGKELTKNATEAGNEILQETKDKIQEEVKKSVKDYFSDMVGKVKGFFRGFFGN